MWCGILQGVANVWAAEMRDMHGERYAGEAYPSPQWGTDAPGNIMPPQLKSYLHPTMPMLLTLRGGVIPI